MPASNGKIRILFLAAADADNVNAQSLNAREIALRLDAQRFESTLFYRNRPDPRLLNHEHIKLLPFPGRFQTLTVLKKMLAGPEIVAYMDCSPGSYLFVHLPRALRRKTRTVLHLEAPADFDGTTKAFRFMYREIMKRCDIWTAITDYVARDHERKFTRTSRYILPVGVDCNSFKPSSSPSKSGLSVLFAGTLVERKEPLEVLEIAAHFPNIIFRMIGGGRNGYERVVADRMAEMGLKNVVLEGVQTQALIAQTMQECDVFLLPSHVEGLPKVTLEAAASGLPAIVCRDYETPSVVDGATGFQVRNRAEMVEKLSVLLSDPQLRQRMGQAARQLAEQFDWDKVSRKWQEAYLSIAA